SLRLAGSTDLRHGASRLVGRARPVSVGPVLKALTVAAVTLAAATLAAALPVAAAASPPPAADPAPAAAPPTGLSESPADTRAFWPRARRHAAEEATAEQAVPGPAGGVPWKGSAKEVRHIGRLFVLAPGGELGTCTAAVVDAPGGNLIATAAHCLYNP